MNQSVDQSTVVPCWHCFAVIAPSRGHPHPSTLATKEIEAIEQNCARTENTINGESSQILSFASTFDVESKEFCEECPRKNFQQKQRIDTS